MVMETDRRQKLPWKCIVSVTVSSRYVRGVKRVALLIYKWLYIILVLQNVCTVSNISVFLFFMLFFLFELKFFC